MKKLLYIGALSTLLLAACSEEKATEDTQTPAPIETVKENEVVVDMAIANDKSIPLEERIAKIATDLFGTTTTDGSDRNITVESMGDIEISII